MHDAPASGGDAPCGDGGACDGQGEGEACTRRRLLVNAALASGAVATAGAIGYPLARFLLPPEVAEAAVASVVAAKVDDPDLKKKGWKTFKMGSKPGILIRLPSGEFLAFNARCTHLACQVSYRPAARDIHCACHNGVYDLTGRNVSGPPPRPLEAFRARVLGDEIVVTRGSA